MAKAKRSNGPASLAKAIASPSAGRPRKPRPATLEGHLGERIETLRKERGWTVGQLADAAGLGNGTLIRLEAGGTSPTLTTLVAIAHAFGMSGERLLRGVQEWSVER